MKATEVALSEKHKLPKEPVTVCVCWTVAGQTLFLPVNALISRNTDKQASVPELTNLTVSKHGTLSMTTLANLFCRTRKLEMKDRQLLVWVWLMHAQKVQCNSTFHMQCTCKAVIGIA